MTNPVSEAELWEQGSKRDRLRNEFVIPTLVRLLSLHAPARLLDVGAGTGYVARAVDKELSYHPQWTLIDISSERLEVAEQLSPPRMSARTVVGDIFSWNSEGESFDAIVLSFTLLEIKAVEKLVGLIGRKLAPGGLLLVVLPDAWADVIRHSRANSGVLQRFLSQGVDVPKVDKFTETQYPFHAMRTEAVIEAATEKGFDLFSLRHGIVGSAAAFVLGFRLRPADS